ncbi:hypothetical protein PR048_024274 [Dryococelus australis]|uniref:Uncharacterized protein n=1 Tax=Dryococelus australis TaxID=614101 RepID=A0ABQ9GN75_9NEOP|nr:hypothetical protein PR048_024274 [Dryococelus australis]
MFSGEITNETEPLFLLIYEPVYATSWHTRRITAILSSWNPSRLESQLRSFIQMGQSAVLMSTTRRPAWRRISSNKLPLAFRNTIRVFSFQQSIHTHVKLYERDVTIKTILVMRKANFTIAIPFDRTHREQTLGAPTSLDSWRTYPQTYRKGTCRHPSATIDDYTNYILNSKELQQPSSAGRRENYKTPDTPRVRDPLVKGGEIPLPRTDYQETPLSDIPTTQGAVNASRDVYFAVTPPEKILQKWSETGLADCSNPHIGCSRQKIVPAGWFKSGFRNSKRGERCVLPVGLVGVFSFLHYFIPSLLQLYLTSPASELKTLNFKGYPTISWLGLSKTSRLTRSFFEPPTENRSHFCFISNRASGCRETTPSSAALVYFFYVENCEGRNKAKENSAFGKPREACGTPAPGAAERCLVASTGNEFSLAHSGTFHTSLRYSRAASSCINVRPQPEQNLMFSWLNNRICDAHGERDKYSEAITNLAIAFLLAYNQDDPGSIPGRVTPDFRMWESCQMIPLVGVFSRWSPVFNALSFRRCSILTSIALIGSQDLVVKSRPNLFTSLSTFSRIKKLSKASAITVQVKTVTIVDIYEQVCILPDIFDDVGANAGEERWRYGIHGMQMVIAGLLGVNPPAHGNVRNVSHMRNIGRNATPQALHRARGLYRLPTHLSTPLMVSVETATEPMRVIEVGMEQLRNERAGAEALRALEEPSSEIFRNETDMQIRKAPGLRLVSPDARPSRGDAMDATGEKCRFRGAHCWVIDECPGPAVSTIFLPSLLPSSFLLLALLYPANVYPCSSCGSNPRVKAPASNPFVVWFTSWRRVDVQPQIRVSFLIAVLSQLPCSPSSQSERAWLHIYVATNGETTPTPVQTCMTSHESSLCNGSRACPSFYVSSLCSAVDIQSVTCISRRGKIYRKCKLPSINGASVGQWLDYSPPPPRRAGFDSRRGHIQIFACGNRARRCRWLAGFIGVLPVSPALAFRRCSILTRLASPSPALKTSMTKAAQIFSTSLHLRETNRAVRTLLKETNISVYLQVALSEEISATLNINVLRADEGEARRGWSCAVIKLRAKREIPEKNLPTPRFPHTKIQKGPRRKSNPFRLGSREAFPFPSEGASCAHIIEDRRQGVRVHCNANRSGQRRERYISERCPEDTLVWLRGSSVDDPAAVHVLVFGTLSGCAVCGLDGPHSQTGFNCRSCHPRFSQVGIVADDTADRRVFSEISVPPPLHPGAAPFSPHFSHTGSQDLEPPKSLNSTKCKECDWFILLGVGSFLIRRGEDNRAVPETLIQNHSCNKETLIQNHSCNKETLIQNHSCNKETLIQNHSCNKETLIQNHSCNKETLIQNHSCNKETLIQNHSCNKETLIQNHSCNKETLIQNHSCNKETLIQNHSCNKETLIQNHSCNKETLIQNHVCPPYSLKLGCNSRFRMPSGFEAYRLL